MNARHALAAVMISAFAASPAAATVLSASSQAVGTKSSKHDYLQVSEVQKELNASMQDVHDAAVANGPLSADVPSTGDGGYLYDADGNGRKHPVYDPFVANPFDDGLDDDRLLTPNTGRGEALTDHSNNRRRMDNRHGGGGGGNRHGGGAHATPEPSTWMLLGAGLALFGGYAVLRRPHIM